MHEDASEDDASSVLEWPVTQKNRFRAFISMKWLYSKVEEYSVPPFLFRVRGNGKKSSQVSGWKFQHLFPFPESNYTSISFFFQQAKQ